MEIYCFIIIWESCLEKVSVFLALVYFPSYSFYNVAHNKCEIEICFDFEANTKWYDWATILEKFSFLTGSQTYYFRDQFPFSLLQFIFQFFVTYHKENALK